MVNGQPPKCVVVVDVQAVYFQCARAIQRSRLWDAVPPGTPRPVPTPGAILASITQGELDGAAYDRELPSAPAGHPVLNGRCDSPPQRCPRRQRTQWRPGAQGFKGFIGSLAERADA